MKKIIIALVFLLLIGGIGGLFYLNSQKKNQESESNAEASDWTDTITYNGKSYYRNPDIKTILFLGIDDVEYEKENLDINNIGRADSLILFIMNSESKEVTLLPISRDTITDIDTYDKNDEYISTVSEQINMQYAYGNTMTRGSSLTLNCVSNLLYGLPIGNYLSLTMDGLSKMVDQIGGISLTFPEDCTFIDPAYEKGATLHLDGAATLSLVRYRDTDEAGSNNDRMHRGSWVITQIFEQFADEDSRDTLISMLSDTSNQYSKEGQEMMKTDLSTQSMQKLASYQYSGNILTIQGENTVEGSHDAFYIDEDALQKLIVENFYLEQ